MVGKRAVRTLLEYFLVMFSYKVKKFIQIECEVGYDLDCKIIMGTLNVKHVSITLCYLNEPDSRAGVGMCVSIGEPYRHADHNRQD